MFDFLKLKNGIFCPIRKYENDESYRENILATKRE